MTERQNEVVEIDGSIGEGGGQVLRSALSLSMITGKTVRLFNIRARRSKPGLMAQHLKSVDAAAAISKANVEGAALHSTALTFSPSSLRSGRYRFEIGTAGAATLVLQTVLLPLSLATASSSVIITGGTHVPWSPCYHYLDLHWLPILRRIGIEASLELEQAGFYPQGGGRINANVRPVNKITGLTLSQPGRLIRIKGISAVSNLPLTIAERQKRQAILRLQTLPDLGLSPDLHIRIQQMPSFAKGTLLLLLAEFEFGQCCYFGLGALGKPAERVADEAVDALVAFLKTGAAADQYLADQLLLPLSIANGPSEIHTCQVTEHLLTNASVIRSFLPVGIEIQGKLGEPGRVLIMPLN